MSQSNFKQLFSNPDVNGNPVLKGEFFIVPNKARKYSEPETEFQKEEAQELKDIYLDKYQEPMVQIWAWDGEDFDSNWSDHGIEIEKLKGVDFEINEFQHGKWREGLFLHHMPSSWLEDKKEGDHLYLQYQNKDGKSLYFDLECKQLGRRYERFGKFEEVLQSVL